MILNGEKFTLINRPAASKKNTIMIKPTYEALPLNQQSSYTLRVFEELEFTAPFHFHPEFELTAILKGKGNRFVGDHMASFDAGDLLLLGSNLPHCWKSETNITHEISAHSVVIQFKQDFLGDNFWNKYEMQNLMQLLEKSQLGIQFTGNDTSEVINKMLELTTIDDPFKRLLTFLDILNDLALSKTYKILNKKALVHAQSAYENNRLHAVQSYLIDHFKQKISLNEIAEVANMSPNAFCKYYKKITQKTFMETVSAYRLNYALQQLLQTEKPITEICFESGFTDVSYFFKTFKSKLNESPLAYRKKVLKNLE